MTLPGRCAEGLHLEGREQGDVRLHRCHSAVRQLLALQSVPQRGAPGAHGAAEQQHAVLAPRDKQRQCSCTWKGASGNCASCELWPVRFE